MITFLDILRGSNMDILSIFLKSQTSWNDLIGYISITINLNGTGESDEFGRRHIWKTFGIEFIAIDKPNLDDDQGIPFSKYNFQLDLLVTDLLNPEETNKFRSALARYLFIKLRSTMSDDNAEVQLVKNLQTLILID